jgi:prophage antirepressor-like protein
MSSIQNIISHEKPTNINIYTFENQIFRVVGSFEEPQFIVKDVCNILGISNPSVAVKNIPEEWKGDLIQIEVSGHRQSMLTLKEPGLYQMIMRSDKEVAKPFQKWVCGEVLTSLRKKGEYVLQEYKEKLEAQQRLLEQKNNDILIRALTVVYILCTKLYIRKNKNEFIFSFI